MIRLMATCAFLLISSSAFAESAEELLSACRPVTKAPVSGDSVQFEQTYDTGFCWGAFSAVQKSIILVDNRKQPLYGVCPPPTSTRTQTIAIFIQYAETHPQRLHEHYLFVVVDALREAFPCPKNS